MLERQFLSCPTCRTPREGVSPQQVEAANRSRAEQGNEPPQVARFAATIFFPDESGGANPFGPLTHHDPSAAVAMPTEANPRRTTMRRWRRCCRRKRWWGCAYR